MNSTWRVDFVCSSGLTSFQRFDVTLSECDQLQVAAKFSPKESYDINNERKKREQM